MIRKQRNYEQTKWLGDGESVHRVGGRSTDVSQIGYSLRARIKEAFPINGVPQEIVVRTEALIGALTSVEKDIEDLIYMVGQEL